MIFRRIFPLLTALWLQFAPVVARLEPMAATLVHPMALLLRWLAAGTAVTGAFHAVSGATGLTVTGSTGVIPTGDPIPATNGAAFTVRFQIKSVQYGIPKTYTYQDLPPGVTRVSAKPDTLQGKPTQSGDYFVTITGWEQSNASGHSAEFVALISVHGIPPVITKQPTNQTVDAGGRATFSVTATGEAPLSYQWLYEDLEINGTEATLVLDSVTADNAGHYRVRVDSPAGPTFSDFATLTVVAPTPPQISREPVDTVGIEGGTVTLEVVATGVEPLTYAWLKEGVEIGDPAINAQLQLGPLTANDAGEYQVRITNPGGDTLSRKVRLTVNAATTLPTILSQTGDLTAFPGESLHLGVTLSVVAGAPAPSFSWEKDGQPVPGATASSLALGPISAADAGSYRIKLQSGGDSLLGNPIQVTVAPRPVLDLALATGGLSVGFSAAAGRDFVLEAQSALGGPWVALRTVSATAGRVESIEAIGLVPQFFRVRLVPLP